MITPLIPLTETLKIFSPLVVDSLKTSLSGSVAVAPNAVAGVADNPLPAAN